MPLPQLEMQPFCPGAEVPGAPLLALEGVQKSDVTPHCPHLSQQAFRGHGLSVDQLVPAGGTGVLGTCGPQTVPATGAGKGGVPELRQMFWFAWNSWLSQPSHPQVSAL